MPGQPPSKDECVEALEVMIEEYGVKRVQAMMEEARENLRKETVAKGDA